MIKNLTKQTQTNKGITLIALVITIIVLLILVGITIIAITGENGILGKGNTAKEKTNEKTATEMINLKITNAQIKSYSETQEMPSLQYLADRLCEDDEIEYVELETQKSAKLKNIIVPEGKTIFTKLREYPYEFEIDDDLRLASINGIKIADSSDSNVKEKMEELEIAIRNLQEQNINLKSKVEKLETETILNQRVKLTEDNFTLIDIPLSTTQEYKKYASIPLKESIKQYKYLEIQLEGKNANDFYWGNRTVFIATEDIQFNNTDTIDFSKEGTNFSLIVDWANQSAVAVEIHFKNEKEIIVNTGKTDQEHNKFIRIKSIHGIK